MRYSIIPAIVTVACLLAISPVQAVDKQATSIVIFVSAKVAIDANGHATVEKIERITDLKPGTFIYEQVKDLLAQRIATWEFVPATRGGQATASQTHLSIWLEGRDIGKGNLALLVRNAYTGGAAITTPSAYPPDAFRSGVEGRVTLVVHYGTDGNVTNTQVESSVASPAGWEKSFRKAASRAVRNWRFDPEQIAGEAVLGSVRVPVVFCLSAGCSGFDAEELPTGSEAVAIDPAVKLRSAVAGTAL